MSLKITEGCRIDWQKGCIGNKKSINCLKNSWIDNEFLQITEECLSEFEEACGIDWLEYYGSNKKNNFNSLKNSWNENNNIAKIVKYFK